MLATGNLARSQFGETMIEDCDLTRTVAAYVMAGLPTGHNNSKTITFMMTLATVLAFGRLQSSDQRRADLFVKAKEKFDSLAVALKRFRSIASIDGSVEFDVSLRELRRHGDGIVQVGQARIGECRAGIKYRLSFRLDRLSAFVR